MDRHRGEVHRALRADRRRHALPGAVGRGGRLLLRRLPRRRRHDDPDQGPVDRGGPAADGRWWSLGPDLLETLGTLQKRFAGFLGQDDPGAPDASRGRVVPVPEHRRRRRRRRPPGDGAPRPGPGVRRGRVPLAVRAAGAVEVPRGAPAVGRPRRDRTSRSTTSPAESHTGMFGGNSNWRGPVWMPVNYLLLRNLQRYARSLGATARDRVPDRERPDASRWPACAEDLRRRLDLAVPAGGPTAADPATAGSTSCRTTPAGATTSRSTSTSTVTTAPGSGASHQTGWTGLVADLICRPDPFAGDGSRGSCDARPADRVRSRGVRHARRGRQPRVAGDRRPRRLRLRHGRRACAPAATTGCWSRATAPAGASRRLGLAALDTVVVVGDRRIRLATHEWVRRCGRPARARAPAPPSTSTTACRGGATTWARCSSRSRWRWRTASAPSRVVHRLLAGRGAPRGDPAVHVARPARRPVRRGRPRRGADGVRLRVRVRLPRGWPGLPARRRVVPRRPPPRGGGPRAGRRREDLWAAGTFTADLSRRRGRSG